MITSAMLLNIKEPGIFRKSSVDPAQLAKIKNLKKKTKLLVTVAVWMVLGGFHGISAKNYYLQLTTKLNWYAAFEACAAQNQQLATINSASEKADQEKIMTAAGRQNEWMWTSGTDQAVAMSFVWMSTGQPFNYTKWTANEPDNQGGDELCVQVWNVNNAIGWNDLGCTNALYYICEDKVCVNGNNSNGSANNANSDSDSSDIVTDLLETLL